MNTDDDLDDIWTFSSNVAWAPEETEPTLKVEQIYGVEPLGIQLGVDVPKTVPDLLYFSLFGQSEPSEAELAVEDDFSAKAPPLQTYAILDGAKIANEEMQESIKWQSILSRSYRPAVAGTSPCRLRKLPSQAPLFRR